MNKILIERLIKFIKFILRFLAWGFVCVSLLLPLLASLSPVQRWCGRTASDILQGIGIHAEIQRAHLGWGGQLVLDELKIYDVKDSTALSASRLAAKVDVLPLFSKKYHFGSIQLNNAHIILSQDSAHAPLNIQHIIEAFSSKDTTSTTPLDLQIRTLTIRHSSIRYDRLDAPLAVRKFNPQHIFLHNISLTASLHQLTGHEARLDIRRFSFQEHSGFALNDLKLDLDADSTFFSLKDLEFSLPGSKLSVPELVCSYPSLPDFKHLKPWIDKLQGKIRVNSLLSPADFTAFVPKLQSFTSPINIHINGSIKEGELEIDSLHLTDKEQNISLSANVRMSLHQPTKEAQVLLTQLSTGEQLSQFLKRNLFEQLPPFIEHLGATHSTGYITIKPNEQQLSLQTTSNVGELQVQATSHNKIDWKTTFSGKHLQPDVLLQKHSLPTNIDLHGQVSISLPEGKNKLAASAELVIDKLLFNKKVFNNISINGNLSNQHIYARIESPNDGANLWAEATVEQSASQTHIVLDGVLKDFRPNALGLLKSMEGESLSSTLAADVTLHDTEHIQGFVRLDDVVLSHDSLGSYHVGNLLVESSYEGLEKQVSLNNPHLRAQIEGNYRWKDLVPSVTSILHTYLPSFVKSSQQILTNNDLSFYVHVQDTVLLQRAFGLSLRLPEKSSIRGQIDTDTRLLDVSANIPQLYFSNEHFSNLSLRAQTTQNVLHGMVSGRRHMPRSTLDIQTELFAEDSKSSMRIAWNGNNPSSPRGSITAHGSTYTDEEGKQAFRAKFEPSTMYVGDTLWHIQPGSFDFHEGRIAVQNVGAYSDGRYMRINGVASREVGDTLLAELKDINVSYIMGLVNFHSVEFDGEASGHVWANSVLSKPQADILLNVKDFTFNGANLGLLTCMADYNPVAKGINLNAHISDPSNKHYTRIDGEIMFSKEFSGLDLRVNTKRFDMAFLHTYTKSFMSRTEGRTSGYARIFGPFKAIDLEGDLELENVVMRINPLNCTYTIPRDSVHLRPGIIYLKQTRVQDERSDAPASRYALVDASLRHRHLSHLTYDLNLDLHRFLAYNQPVLGTESFCGTAVLEGAVHLWGGNNDLHVDFSGTPLNGSTLTYNATQPDKLTEANFIRFKQQPKDSVARMQPLPSAEQAPGTDIFLNFDLNVTPDVALRVLMDTRSGDHIDIRGAGHLRASYFNKGNFKLYGTYQVEEGQYDLSIQEFLHKEFSLQRGGTIVFGGNPNVASLDIKAAYTVPNVSIDDLSTTSLGLPNTRVDCIMHISGQPRQPSVTFDFELPTANEEERQMVRSLLSTEEERNLQVIYLLGIGRFLNMDAASNAAGQNSQSQKAVNSIVSSTISNQFNRVLTTLLGNSNWNLGTNLRTGQMGWDNVDVEGVLSGKLFNNRLLINGNFGYRERFYNSSNFIGDFDVKYLITPSGSIGLKAFNKSNDRYFIQSSLNTQGVGIQLKKDFTNFFEIFSKKNKKKEQQTIPTEH